MQSEMLVGLFKYIRDLSGTFWRRWWSSCLAEDLIDNIGYLFLSYLRDKSVIEALPFLEIFIIFCSHAAQIEQRCRLQKLGLSEKLPFLVEHSWFDRSE